MSVRAAIRILLVSLVFAFGWPRTASANTLYFPQVAVGGGYSTTFVIMNTGSSPVAAPVAFYNQDGSTNTTYQQSLNIPAGGSVRFTLTSSDAAIKVMWAKVLAGVGTVQGVATFDFRSAN